MIDRMMGVFKLDAKTFEDIEADQGATGQAAVIVLVVALLGGIGAGGFNAIMGEGDTFLTAFLFTVLSTVIGWVLWSVVTYFVGTALFGGQSSMGEMLRVIGFAYTPQLLRVIPCLGAIIGGLWTLAAGFVAVRQGLDLDNTKAFLTIVVGFIAYVALSVVLGGVTAGIGAVLGG
ncbi:MAG: YIP1 family protein [Chloroflexota bacterium]